MKINLFLLLLLLSLSSYSQGNLMAKKVFSLINEARSNPKAFLTKHKATIEKFNPRYAKFLLTQKTIPNAIWDKGLVAMAESSVEKKDLNPIYKGINKLCGQSAGGCFSDNKTDPIYYLCDFYTNIHDEDYKYFGIYFNKDTSKCYFEWGITCVRKKVQFSFNDKVDTSMVNYDELNTGKSVTYLSAVEKQMLQEINFVRAYPKVYAKVIAKHLFDESKSVFGLNNDTYLAGIELINELNALNPLPILQPSQCIYIAAKKHGVDCQKRGFIEHQGSDGSWPKSRILRECKDYKYGSENCASSSSENPRKPIINLLIDDGISSRGHRQNLLDPNWKYCACFRYSDKTYGYEWVQNFAY